MSTQNTSKTTTRKGIVKKTAFIYVVLVLVIAGLLATFIVPPLLEKPVEKQETTKENGFMKEGTVDFITADNHTTSIDVELARTEEEQSLGLMFRESMETNQGMLFIFPTQEFKSFWMKNTIISLDMLFVTDSLEIATIHKNTIPFSEKSCPSSRPVKYVIEVVAGFCDQYNIKVGDKVRLHY